MCSGPMSCHILPSQFECELLRRCCNWSSCIFDSDSEMNLRWRPALLARFLISNVNQQRLSVPSSDNTGDDDEYADDDESLKALSLGTHPICHRAPTLTHAAQRNARSDCKTWPSHVITVHATFHITSFVWHMLGFLLNIAGPLAHLMAP